MKTNPYAIALFALGLVICLSIITLSLFGRQNDVQTMGGLVIALGSVVGGLGGVARQDPHGGMPQQVNNQVGGTQVVSDNQEAVK